MNKNAIKKFAVWARRELIERVSQRAHIYGISADTQADAAAIMVNGQALNASEQKQREILIKRIREKGYDQVMEEVAYTWFNRFAAIRFMEVNGYLPSHIRVFTDDDGNFKPQILTEAIHLDLDGLDMEKVYALERGNKKEELFKYLLIVQCNALNQILPGMFQKIKDYTELLLPDYLLREGSVIERMVKEIAEEDWTDQVQIIGWLYQYYNTEPKDQVFTDLKKNIKISKEKIPAATQLFTPDWIVHYMVENSLGRLWIEGHPDSAVSLLPSKEEKAAYAAGERNPTDTKWYYYLEEAPQEPEVEAQLKEIRKAYSALKPEEILCIDPCMGSGHILCVLFDVLVKIYEDYGYTAREAAVSIVKNNLWGLDIDDRAAQLAYFAVMMKARQYDRRFLSRGIQPHVYGIVDSSQWVVGSSQLLIDGRQGKGDSLQGIGDRGQLAAGSPESTVLDYFCNGDEKLSDAMRTIITKLHDAKEYGSILTTTEQDWSAIYARFDEIRYDISIHKDNALALEPLVHTAQALGQKYHVTVTNPPYMGSSNLNANVANYIKKHYPDSKTDLFAVFIERCGEFAVRNCFQAMITQHAWMFLSSFEKLRTKLLVKDTVNMAHLGARAFEEIGGEVVQTTSFVLRNAQTDKYQGTYCRLIEPNSQDGKEQLFLSGEKRYTARQDNFSKIPGSPVAYWLNNKAISKFDEAILLKEISKPKTGMRTGDNDRFLRHWYEVDFNKIGLHMHNAKEAASSRKKWFPYNKGGDFQLWYGNNLLVVNWEYDGAEIKKNTRRVYPQLGDNLSWKITNEQDYFKEGITWTALTSSKNSFRYSEEGFIFDSNKGPMIFAENGLMEYLLGFFNSPVSAYYLNAINPSLSLQNGDIANLPIIRCDIKKEKCINELTRNCIDIVRHDWDSFETSWDFARNPLVVYSRDKTINECYNIWERACQDRCELLKLSEEQLYSEYIEIYDLADYLSQEVTEKDLTVHRAEKNRDIKGLISYAVGCMFGRYSIYQEGLIYAGGQFSDAWGPILKQLGLTDNYQPTTTNYFLPDKDAIIPICDDEYFEDDIVGLFVKFIETVYGADTLEENLRFIADALGVKGSTSREVIRNYFLNDFYKDHLKTYQKRPIYWLFDSGKKHGFKCLIYMHRYRPDTIARIRTDYVHEQQSRYRTAIADLKQHVSNASASERMRLNKQLQKLTEQSEEARAYEEKIHHLADRFISIDLDDGVKVNYAKFQDVLAKIK